jgi:hypothetical protein
MSALGLLVLAVFCMGLIGGFGWQHVATDLKRLLMWLARRGVPVRAAWCYDCGRQYGDQFGFPDLVVPHRVWLKISPNGHEGDRLCPSCMCKRAYMAGIDSEARFMSGPFNADGPWDLIGNRL